MNDDNDIQVSSARFLVAFDLPRERPDWPPIEAERLWGEKTPTKFEIRVQETPFFIREVAMGDLVRVRPDNERRELVFESYTAESGHSTIRLVMMRPSEQESSLQKL